MAPEKYRWIVAKFLFFATQLIQCDANRYHGFNMGWLMMRMANTDSHIETMIIKFREFLIYSLYTMFIYIN